MPDRSLRNIFALLLVSLLAISHTYAQLTSSPLSRFGIGETGRNVFSQGFSMGGTGISLNDPAYVHFQNPASYGWLDLTVFETGLQSASTRQSDFSDSSAWHHSATFSHAAFGIPLMKSWGLSFGILPYSGVNYNISETVAHPVAGSVETSYRGDGGINRAYIGTGFRIRERLGIGVNVSYLFGSNEYERRVRFTYLNTFNSLVMERFSASGLKAEAGLQYKMQLGEKLFLTVGGVYEPGLSISGRRDHLAVTYDEGSNFELWKDTLSFYEDQKGTIQLPSSYAGGISLAGEKWTVALEGRQMNWNELRVFDTNDSLLSGSQLSLGAQYIPDKYAVNSFFRSLRYRAGLRYNSGFHTLDGSKLPEYGISFGLAIPLKKSLSTLNAGIEFSQRQTDFYREQFIRFRFGISINDRWFVQRKYN